MTKRFLLAAAVAAVLLLSACYNKPTTSLKKPGDGPEHIHGGPSIGPGTTAGGSTAGPQPKAESHAAEAEKAEAPRPGTEKAASEHGAETTHDGAEKKH